MGHSPNSKSLKRPGICQSMGLFRSCVIKKEYDKYSGIKILFKNTIKISKKYFKISKKTCFIILESTQNLSHWKVHMDEKSIIGIFQNNQTINMICVPIRLVMSYLFGTKYRVWLQRCRKRMTWVTTSVLIFPNCANFGGFYAFFLTIFGIFAQLYHVFANNFAFVARFLGANFKLKNMSLLFF